MKVVTRGNGQVMAITNDARDIEGGLLTDIGVLCYPIGVTATDGFYVIHEIGTFPIEAMNRPYRYTIEDGFVAMAKEESERIRELESIVDALIIASLEV